MRTAIALLGALALAPLARAQVTGTTTDTSTIDEAATAAQSRADAAAAEADAAALQARVGTLETQLTALQRQNQQAQDQIAALQQQNAQAQDQVAALQQQMQAERQRQQEFQASRLSRVALLNEAVALLTRTRTALEAGSYDVAPQLQEASERLAEVAAQASRFGGQSEAGQASAAQASVDDIRSALDREDFSAAKDALAAALFRITQARTMAQTGPNPAGG